MGISTTRLLGPSTEFDTVVRSCGIGLVLPMTYGWRLRTFLKSRGRKNAQALPLQKLIPMTKNNL